jgi:hypothetical protein
MPVVETYKDLIKLGIDPSLLGDISANGGVAPLPRYIVVKQTFTKGAGWGTSYIITGTENGVLPEGFDPLKIEPAMMTAVTLPSGAPVYSNWVIRTKANLITATVDTSGNFTLSNTPSTFYSSIVLHCVYRLNVAENCENYKIEDIVTPEEVNISRDAIDVDLNSNILSGVNVQEGLEELANSILVVESGVVNAVDTTAGISDAGKLVKLASDGLIDDSMIRTVLDVSTVIRVSKTGGAQFDNIYSANEVAKASCSVNNPYVILVEPGIYTEPELTLVAGTTLIGRSQKGCIIIPDSAHNIINLETNADLMFLTLKDATSNIGINCKNIDEYCLIHKVSVINCYYGIYFEQEDTFTNGQLYLEYVDTQSSSSNDTGMYFKTPLSTGFNDCYLFVQAQETYCYGLDGTNPLYGILTEGDFNEIILANSGCFGYDGTGTGIEIKNTPSLSLQSFQIDRFNISLNNENDTGSLLINAVGFISTNSTTYDLRFVNPLIHGVMSGSWNSSKVETTVVTTSLVRSYQDTKVGAEAHNVIGRLQQGFNIHNIIDIGKISRAATTTGIYTGGEITSGITALTVNVASGEGFLFSTDIQEVRQITWPDSIINIDPESQNHIYVNQDGNILVSNTTPNKVETIILGKVITIANNDKINVATHIHMKQHGGKIEEMLRHGIGVVHAEGGIVSENVTPYKLDVGDSEYYYGSTEFVTSGGSGITFNHYWRSGITWDKVTTDLIDNQYYDGGSGLILMSAPSGSVYRKDILLVSTENNIDQYHLVFGQELFYNLTDAEFGSIPTYDSSFEEGISRLATIIIEKDAPNIIEIRDIRRLYGSKQEVSQTVTIHNDLSGRDSANAHTQYLLKAGDTMAGTLNMGSNPISNASNINGVVVESHASRHLPNSGTDALAVATPSNIGVTNVQGNANSFSASNHVHAHSDLSLLSGYVHHSPAQVGLADAVIGPASALDNAIVLYDSTSGKLVKASNLLLDPGINPILASVAVGFDTPRNLTVQTPNDNLGSGVLSLKTGNVLTSGNSGAAELRTGNGTLLSGAITIQTGDAATSSSGGITIKTGTAVAEAARGIILLDTVADSVQLQNQPTGVNPAAVATTQYVDSKVASPQEVTASNNQLINSATLTQITGMSITPTKAGIYLITFSTYGACTGATTECEYSISKDGVEITSSIRRFKSVNNGTLFTQAVVTSTGIEVFTAKARIVAGSSITLPSHKTLSAIGR